jgi:hypothetical protein
MAKLVMQKLNMAKIHQKNLLWLKSKWLTYLWQD